MLACGPCRILGHDAGGLTRNSAAQCLPRDMWGDAWVQQGRSRGSERAMATRLTIEDMQETARSRGGECLSRRYVNSTTKLRWRCAEGHEWMAVPAAVRFGAWCSACYSVRRGSDPRAAILQLRRLAAGRGGKCLSPRYLGSGKKLRWMCSEGHVWEAPPESIRRQRRHWCPECARGGPPALTIKHAQTTAKTRGGACLSRGPIQSRSRLRWRCANGHEWQALFSGVRSGSWCPQCARKTTGDCKRRWNVDALRRIAADKGGRLKSSKYVNNHQLLEWECAHGHSWRATFGNILLGRWCRQCAVEARRSGIGKAQQVAKERGGFCLSTTYVNHATKLVFECAKGHRWGAPLGSVLTGHWCRKCFQAARTSRIAGGRLRSAQDVARMHGGTILEVGGNSTASSLWKCEHGHVFTLSLENALHGSWCRSCHGWTGEAICRSCFETLFDAPFPSSKPRWLRYPPSGAILQLDGFNAVLGVAFEYQGQQHSSVAGGQWLKHRAAQFRALKLRDSWKLRTCRKNAVTLVRIHAPTSLDAIPELVRRTVKAALARSGQKIPPALAEKPLTLRRPTSGPPMQRLRAYVEAKGGRVHAAAWMGVHGSYEFECSRAHKWRTKALHILGGHSWCPRCSGNARHSIEEMQTAAARHGGACLSRGYLNNKAKLRWRCGNGHEFEQSANHVLRGHWCARCGHARGATVRRLGASGRR